MAVLAAAPTIVPAVTRAVALAPAFAPAFAPAVAPAVTPVAPVIAPAAQIREDLFGLVHEYLPIAMQSRFTQILKLLPQPLIQ